MEIEVGFKPSCHQLTALFIYVGVCTCTCVYAHVGVRASEPAQGWVPPRGSEAEARGGAERLHL